MRPLINLCRRLYCKHMPTSAGFHEECNATIYAVATGGVRSALSVIRVSGPNSSLVVKNLGRYSGRDTHKFPKPRFATLRKLYDPNTGSLLDHGILLWFPGPHSYTGEDCCEFHIHGSVSVITGVLKAIGSIAGCHPAEAGEFTKRAFLNGKLDLTEVDGLADLIAAETEFQRVQALKQMGGGLSRMYHNWRDRLAKCLANSEAFIDFGEDENIESDVLQNVAKEVTLLVQEISNHLQDQKKGQRLRDGARVAIIGRPNVGKSTLLNKLCGRDAAIVSNIPGTTRDVIETCMNIHGFPVIFADTAGIRHSTTDSIENEGMKRSLKEIETADLILLLTDTSNSQLQLNLQSCSLKEQLLHDLLSPSFTSEDPKNVRLELLVPKTILIVNKIDLIQSSEKINNQPFANADCQISCKTDNGVDQMHQLIRKRIMEICGDPNTDPPHVTQERYRVELNHCLQNLIEFLEFKESDLALRTQYLKQSINAVGRITGHVGTEQILDIIFRDFCIGK